MSIVDRVEGPSLDGIFMVFDVESIGLHGEGFAVGYVVINRRGDVLEEQVIACDPDEAHGLPKDRRWVDTNVPALPRDQLAPAGVRGAFWHRWQHWKAQGAVLVADCCWPVEARFLAAAVDDCRPHRDWAGPYPLHDLASVLLALGRDPLATNDRLPDELPAHHPLMDARQSARQLVEALRDAMAPAAPAAAMLGELWVAFGNYEGRLIALPEYAAASERAVKEKILEAARREGFAGTSDERIGALGWTIRRVLPTDASPSQPLPASGGDKEKT